MRLAVLLCGVLSGVIALGFGWWGQADALLHVAGLADTVRLAVALAIQPIALASIAGGAAILISPSISRATLLSSAVGWLALVAILGGGISVPVAVLILLSAAGGLLGFLPSLKEPMFRLQRADAVEDEDEAEEAIEIEPLRPVSRAAMRYEQEDVVSARATEPSPQVPQDLPREQTLPPAPVYQASPWQAEPVQPAQPRPQYQAGPLSAADLQRALEAMRPQPPEPAAVQAPPPPAVPGQMRLKPRLTFSRLETMEAPAPVAPAPPQPELPPSEPLQPEPPAEAEALPTLGNVMPPLGGDGGWQVYFPPPELAVPVPTKPPEIGPAAALVPRIELDEEDHSQPFVPSPEDLRDMPVAPPPPVAATPAVRHRKAERPPYDFRRKDEAPARRPPRPKQRSRAARRRAAVGIGALAVVIIGAPAFLVLDAQMRGGGAQALPAIVDASSSASSASGSSAPASREVGDARLPRSGPLAALDAAPAAPTIVSAASSEAPVATVAAVPMAKGPPYASPFDYCSALDNSDAPDATKITGGMPAALAAAARSTAKLNDGDFHWRCMDKAVWVCVAAKGSPACKPVPNAVDRGLFCAAHPDVQVTNSAAGDWSCDGFTPVVSKALLSAVDRRGFDRNAWRQLPAPSAG